MPDSLHLSISFLLAQTAPSASPATTGTSPVVFWSAILLVAAGLAILGIAGANWLRSRRSQESGIATDYEPTPIPARPAPLPAIAVPERTERLPSSARAAQPSSSTMEAQNLLRLMGEAEELCTRLGRELDDKAQRIERLLARAEGRLGSDLQPLHQPAAASTPPRPEIVTRPVAVPSPVQPTPNATPFAFTGPSPYYNSAPTATQPMPQHVQTRIAAPVAAQPAPAPTPTASFGIDALTRDIYTLADAGHSVTAIAQQLGQHTGKVELILALRPG